MVHSNLFLKFGYPRAPFGLGIGRYVCQLQRITLKFCKNHGSSLGIRQFLENDLIDFAKDNPGVVVYVKPRRHRSPVIKAEYLNGEIQWMNVAKYSHKDIIQFMELLRTQYHDGSSLRLLKLWHTNFPSIQGPWTPFTFKDPSLNHANFPNKELGKYIMHKSTATEELIRLYENQQESEREEKENKVGESIG
ncbi:mitochondrial ribosomal protein L43 [Ptiloglossa arizonensis]|uniref:mitochondrial ribosomal protein L43 n=1 Tax=Ptiloglossa arizonensis TaxID=3350558 RepID=UPI003FA15E01